MKKILLTSILFLGFISLSQAQYYDFDKTTETYSPIAGGTVVSWDDWDDTLITVEAPFDFEVCGVVIDSISFDDYSYYFLSNDEEIAEMAVFGADLKSREGNTSPISHKVIGSAPNRVFVIQFENATTYNDQDGEDSVNFQLQIHETTNIVEFHYGPSFVNNDADAPWDLETGCWAGIIYYGGDRGSFLSGSPANPTVNQVTLSNYDEVSLTGHPLKDRVYVWTPRQFPVTVPAASAENTITAYPNPFSNVLTVNTTSTIDFTLTDAQGKIITIFTVHQKYELNTSDLSQGVYFLRSSNGNVMKLVK